MIKNYKIKIELLSDMCIWDGGVYNCMLDIDVCYDMYGIPYIPAKRLKGCLREAALELNDWGVDIDVEKIFGGKGSYKNASNIVLSNAYIVNYENLTGEIEDNKEHYLYHQQRVLSNYTYVRNQTSIDYETGIADDFSLRSMRVIKKGLIFEAKTKFDDSLFDELNKCVKVLTNMGISRTRGLGEVKASLIEDELETNLSEDKEFDGENIIYYELFLREPVITLSANGLQEQAKDYIEGSSIMGIVLSRLSGPTKESLLGNLNSVCFSNAYILQNGIRYTEVPAYISSIKNNHKDYINNLYYDRNLNEGIQINVMKHAYVDINGNTLNKIDVDLEQRYHHRRPDDKSIGRAKSQSDGDSDFYQIESIKGGQRFAGFISGDSKMIEIIHNAITLDTECRLGYGRNAEYGLSNIKVTKIGKLKESKALNTKRLVVKLNSPTIVYNDRAMYSVSIDDLVEEIAYALRINVEDIDIESTCKYVNYTNISGYNVTWNTRKPTLTVFDKGSAVDIHFKNEIMVQIPDVIYIGERSTEGYGECSAFIPDENEDGKGVINKRTSLVTDVILDVSQRMLGKELAKGILNEYVRSLVIEKAKGATIDEKTKATVSNMLLMCKEFNSLQSVKNAVEDRYSKRTSGKEDKEKIAKDIINIAENEVNKESFIKGLENRYKLKGIDLNKEEIYMMFLTLYLKELKYMARPERSGK